MSKSLKSFDENVRARVAAKRASQTKDQGLGYWGAKDYLRRKAVDITLGRVIVALEEALEEDEE